MSADGRSFWVLGMAYNGGAVLQKLPPDCPETYEFDAPAPLAPRFPSGGVMRYSSDFPKEKKLLDQVCTTLGLPVVSARFRAVLEELCPRDCEFLPVTLRDHKNKVASKEHSILHVLRVEDAIDMERSRYRRDGFRPSLIDKVEDLRLDLAAIPPDARLLRPRTMPGTVLLDALARERLVAAALTGLRLYPAEGWDGDDF